MAPTRSAGDPKRRCNYLILLVQECAFRGRELLAEFARNYMI